MKIDGYISPLDGEAYRFVYFFKANATQTGVPVKIGSSTWPRSRLAACQTGCPFELECIGVFWGGHKGEKLLHQRLRRYRMRGEWYDLSVAWRVVREATDAMSCERLAERILDALAAEELRRESEMGRVADLAASDDPSGLSQEIELLAAEIAGKPR